MAVKEPFMVKQVYGNTDFELEAKPGTSLLVKDIIIENPATAVGYVTIKTALSIVGFFRVSGNLGNHLSAGMGSPKHSHDINCGETALTATTADTNKIVDALKVEQELGFVSNLPTIDVEKAVQFGNAPNLRHQTLIGLLTELGHFGGYPVAEGEKLILEDVKQAGCLQLAIYQINDAGDFKSEMPNGSKASEYLFINYGRPTGAVTTKVATIYDDMQSPEEYPDFPFAKDVPANRVIDIIGILASDLVDWRSAADCVFTDYIKLIRERETLFDEDKNGLIHVGVVGTVDAETQIARGYSLFGNYSTIDHKPPMLFTPPLTFSAGEELGIYVHTDIGTAAVTLASLAAADLEIGLIEKVRVA